MGYQGEREAYGRCEPCKLIYQWAGAPRVCDAKCNRCGRALQRAQLRTPGKRVFEVPLGLLRAAN